jgi:hypothetical protein
MSTRFPYSPARNPAVPAAVVRDVLNLFGVTFDGPNQVVEFH